IVHTLRTRGDMDFDDISRVVPWIETSAALGIDLNAEQRAEPRVFKSHLGWDAIPKGGRYINVVRDPADALVSMYRFAEGWFFEPGTVELEEFALTGFVAERGYYKHLKSWWPRRNDPDVLFLAYEQMQKDTRRTIRRVADFIGVALDDALLDLTEEHASMAFMLAHKDRFDDYLMRKLSEERLNLPEGSDSAKVREGKSGGGAVLSGKVRAELERLWAEEITAPLGYPDYASLIAELEG
ncbi:MAG TPA: sulfotransferase domain-containing protein, partial [Pseudomonadales bacterium]